MFGIESMLQTTINTKLCLTVLYMIWFIFVNGRFIHAKNVGLCDTIGGQSNIILDIEESRGNSTNQKTIPEQLPIVGDVDKEILLDLNFKNDKQLFALHGKNLSLLLPLDRDTEPKSYIIFEISCLDLKQKKKKTIPVIVRITDINDNAPIFQNLPYKTSISELTPIGTTIYKDVYAADKDTGLNERVEYKIVPTNRTLAETATFADGFGYFAINLSHDGQIVVNRSLDYEKTKQYLVTIVASDRARNLNDRFSATATLTVSVEDADDQEPAFIYSGCTVFERTCINPEYTATVLSGKLNGLIDIHPEKIKAFDMDTLNAPIRYSFVDDDDNDDSLSSGYVHHFEINSVSAEIIQKRTIDTSSQKQFTIFVKAEELSNNSYSSLAKLIVTVRPVDSNSPKLHSSSPHGFVDENSDIGTIVLDANQSPIKFRVTDDDFEINDLKPSYTYELTTDSFRVNENGILVVNDDRLDREPPNQEHIRFQVVAKEVNGSGASAPLAMQVQLNDINDNAPVLPTFAPVYRLVNDKSPKVIQIQATDSDVGVNAAITYAIKHVSDNGYSKFRIDEKSGTIEAVDELKVRDHYIITVEARNFDGLNSHAIVEVYVKPGPNTKSPVFTQPIYELEISEGVSVNSSIATITAIDPENEPIKYSLMFGDDLKQFNIDSNTGVLSILRRLDREDLTRYQLVIKAEDSGGLSSSATVNILVTDINDKNPEFEQVSYRFKVEEGQANRSVGIVSAKDLDDGVNSEISYFVSSDVPFSIGRADGQIFTKSALDYENENLYKIIVTAQDNGSEPRIGTCTVTIEVTDIEDEVPKFPKTAYEISVAENLPQYPLVKVQARDKDKVERITYEIRQGAKNLFKIDERSGEIFTTTKGLDFETDTKYSLVVGTRENRGSADGDFARVTVHVLDKNDLAPMFTHLPRPATLDDEAEIETTVFRIHAIDSDGTAPNNKVKYELVGHNKSMKYFQIDAESGVVSVRGDLKTEADSEYEIDVRAYDLGEPQMHSIATLHVFVRHIATVAPEVGLGFADDSYTIELNENATKGSLVKIFNILNNQMHNIPLKCYIISGNGHGKFAINTTADQNCALFLNDTLDYELANSYIVDLQIDSLHGFVNPSKSTAVLKVAVSDMNDNKPYFVFPDVFNEVVLSEKKFYAAISKQVEISAHVIQIKAKDRDSGQFGKLAYRLLGDKKVLQYFKIDRDTGIVTTQNIFNDVTDSVLPFRLVVQVNDNPNETLNSNYIEVSLVINLITEENRIILAVGDASPDKVLEKKGAIVKILQDHSGLLTKVEKITTRYYLSDNGSLEVDATGSDVWLYTIDPRTDKILARNSSVVRRTILAKEAMSKIIFEITGTIKHTAFSIHEPFALKNIRTILVASASADYDLFPYAIVTMACIIFVICVLGIFYLYVSWPHYKTVKEQSHISNYSSTVTSSSQYRQHRNQSLSTNTLTQDLNYTEIVPPSKEYETQILQMSVPVDDSDSNNDLQFDFSSRSHIFKIDKVSYINKNQNDLGNRVQSNTFKSNKMANGNLNIEFQKELSKAVQNNANSFYQNTLGDDNLKQSAINQNVLFMDKNKAGVLKSHETTTEL